MIIAQFDESSEFMKDGEMVIAYDNKVKPIDTTWDMFAEILAMKPTINNKKISVKMFSGWEYTLPEDAYETKEDWKTKQIFTRKVLKNLIRNWLLVIDYDDKIFMSDFIDAFGEYEFAMYTSFSHHAALGFDKFRVVMPMTQAVDVKTWLRMEDGLLELFKDCDQTSFEQNRSFFLPHATIADKDDYIFYHNKGKLFDPNIIPLTEEKIRVVVPIIRTGVVGGKGKILLNTVDIVGYFQSLGLYDKKNGRQKHLVECPWEAGHTSTSSGTAIWEGDMNNGAGFNCFHHSCKKKNLYDVVQHYGWDSVRQFCETKDYEAEAKEKVIQTHKGKLLAKKLSQLTDDKEEA